MSATLWTTRLAQFAVGTIYLLAMTYAWADQGAQTWQVEPFDRIYVTGDLMVELHQSDQGPGEATTTISARGPGQLLADLVVEVVDSTLYLDAEHLKGATALAVDIDIAAVREVVMDGQGTIIASDLVGRNLVLEGVGAGAFDLQNLQVEDLVVIGTGFTQFRLSGSVLHQNIELAGSGEYFGDQLRSRTSEVLVRGQGDVNIWADEMLDINVHGAAQVRYSGSAQVHRRIFGRGAVSRIPSYGATSL